MTIFTKIIMRLTLYFWGKKKKNTCVMYFDTKYAMMTPYIPKYIIKNLHAHWELLLFEDKCYLTLT